MKYKTLLAGVLLALPLLSHAPAAADTVDPTTSERPTPDGGGSGTGCESEIQLRGDVWREHGYYNTWGRLGQYPVPLLIDVVAHETVGYWYCPNGDRPDKVKVKWIDWCWFQPNRSEHWFFTGVTFNTYFWDESGRNVNPGAFKVGDDGTDQNCATQDVSADKEAWMRMSNMPRLRSSFTINLNSMSDDEWNFETRSGGAVNYIIPGLGIILGDWFS